MSLPDDGTLDGGAGETQLRLHPGSWLFVLLQQARQFFIPLVALVVFGQRGDREDHYGLLISFVVIGVLVAVSVMQYLTYRYRLGADAIHIRSGLLERSWRDIPYARIHNVVLHQSVLHRMFGVAEVRLESAGGARPEAQMRVLRLDRALALEQRVRHGAHAPSAPAAERVHAAAAPAQRLLSLSTAEVIRLGLISNRGMVVVAAAFGVLYQTFPQRAVNQFISSNGEQAYRYVHDLHPGLAATAAVAMVLALALLLAMRVLSVVLALVQYHGFTLSEIERRLTIERGLLTRVRTSTTQRRIQAWTLREGFLHRVLRRRRLQVDIAASQQRDEHGRAFRDLAPIATPQACDDLIAGLLPHAAWPPAQWLPVPQRNGWRLALPSLWLLPLAAVMAAYLGPWSWWLLAWWPWSLFAAYRQVARMGYAVDGERIVVRGGWWDRWWRLAELDKLQALQLSRSPLDRLCGTASLWLDTAGAHGSGPALRLRLLPLAEAEALQAQLAARLARRRLQW
ncbi:MAG TPA: PH domain-containing protein [Stenotrophomonas sp.]